MIFFDLVFTTPTHVLTQGLLSKLYHTAAT
jgi:hypothetical protein